MEPKAANYNRRSVKKKIFRNPKASSDELNTKKLSWSSVGNRYRLRHQPEKRLNSLHLDDLANACRFSTEFVGGIADTCDFTSIKNIPELKEKKCVGIVNTSFCLDRKDNHWLCLYRVDDTIKIFDSMPKKDLETATMKLKNYLQDSEDNKRKSKLRCAIERFCVENNESSFKLEYYALGHQTDLHSCGYWASVYRACILKGEPYLEKCRE